MNACKLLRKSIFYGLLCTVFIGTSFSRPLSVQAETITAYTSDTPNGLPEDAFSDYWKMATKTYTYTPQVNDYTTVQGDSSSLTAQTKSSHMNPLWKIQPPHFFRKYLILQC